MLGSIIGDIVGSIYEFDNIKTKDFPFFSMRMEYTDDSILTIATADWLLNGGNSGSYYHKYATKYPYPMGSYGTMFIQWVHKANRGIIEPYNSCGNIAEALFGIPEPIRNTGLNYLPEELMATISAFEAKYGKG